MSEMFITEAKIKKTKPKFNTGFMSKISSIKSSWEKAREQRYINERTRLERKITLTKKAAELERQRAYIRRLKSSGHKQASKHSVSSVGSKIGEYGMKAFNAIDSVGLEASDVLMGSPKKKGKGQRGYGLL